MRVLPPARLIASDGSLAEGFRSTTAQGRLQELVLGLFEALTANECVF